LLVIIFEWRKNISKENQKEVLINNCRMLSIIIKRGNAIHNKGCQKNWSLDQNYFGQKEVDK
jgi:hypothetical protein